MSGIKAERKEAVVENTDVVLYTVDKNLKSN